MQLTTMCALGVIVLYIAMSAGGALYLLNKRYVGKHIVNVPVHVMDKTIEVVTVKRYPILGRLFDVLVSNVIFKPAGFVEPEHHWIMMQICDECGYITVQKDWSGNVLVIYNPEENGADSDACHNTALRTCATEIETMTSCTDCRTITVREIVAWCKNYNTRYDLLINNCQRIVREMLSWLHVDTSKIDFRTGVVVWPHSHGPYGSTGGSSNERISQ